MKLPKNERKQAILFGLVDLHIKTGKPIGSNTLRENGFEDVSSATIRNYFAKLEEEELLVQQHSSGGRIPTAKAYKLFAIHTHEKNKLLEKDQNTSSDDTTSTKRSSSPLTESTSKLSSYLQKSAEYISNETGCSVFFSSPRFDQDFLVDFKLVGIDHERILCVAITNFGTVLTEILYVKEKLSHFQIKRIESYFHFRLTGLDKPTLTDKEEEISLELYNEILLRHIVGHTNFTNEDIFKTGFSKLLNYPEFHEATSLANALSLFENTPYMIELLQRSTKSNKLSFLVGEELVNLSNTPLDCAIIMIPYHIHNKAVGSIAILGPMRLDYEKLFSMLQEFSEKLSHTLTKSMYKFKITYREPKQKQIDLKNDQPNNLGQIQYLSIK